MHTVLTGSYDRHDCQFLLKPLEFNEFGFTSIADKEHKIQSGQIHYSETINQESPATPEYMALFHQLVDQYRDRLANDIVQLAQQVTRVRDLSRPLVVISLARAGTPIGVLLTRALRDLYDAEAHHFSVSIIRDKGLDHVAMDHILDQGFAPEQCLFLDGWTAKGVITRELKQSVQLYNASRGLSVPDELFVVSDIGGSADYCATTDDYIIPSALLNSTVSGLISRSILNDQIESGEFHGCVVYEHLREHDVSRWFVDQISERMALQDTAGLIDGASNNRQSLNALTLAHVDRMMSRYRVSDINRIKPGVAEATRVMLRRVPDLLIVRNPDNLDVSHLIQIAREKGIQVEMDAELPFNACALIKDILKK